MGHYEVESSNDGGGDWKTIGGLFRDLYAALFKRRQMDDAFDDVSFRVVRVTREPVDVDIVEER